MNMKNVTINFRGQQFKWDTFAFKAGACIYLQHPKNKGRILPDFDNPEDPEGKDIPVADVHYGKVRIFNIDLFNKCPFDEFRDGYTFCHPRDGWIYVNEGATPIRKNN